MSNHLAVVDLMAENGRLIEENEALRKLLEDISNQFSWPYLTDEYLQKQQASGNQMAGLIMRARAALALKEPGQ